MLVMSVYAFLVALFSLMPFLLVPAFLPPVMRLFLESGLMIMDPFLCPPMALFLLAPLALPVRVVNLHSIAPLRWAKTQYEE